MEYIFEKYRVNGKDYLLFDTKRNEYELTKEQVRRICHHHFGVGVSGMIMGYYEDAASNFVKSFDVNGNQEEQNYNAICAFTEYLKENHKIDSGVVKIQTICETITVEVSAVSQEDTKQSNSQITMSIVSNDLCMAAGAETTTAMTTSISFLSSQVKETGKVITAEQFIKSL